jgi:hypothetical protein
MRKLSACAATAAFLMLCAGSVSAQSVLVCNRGLPTANLNNAAGSSRSNVAWSFGNDWITGDDCPIGAAGETWVVTNLTGWSVTGTPGNSALGDRFKSVALYLGTATSPLTPVSTGNLTANTNTDSNSSITHAAVKYADGSDYQGSSGSYIQMWQTDFNNLGYVVAGGTKLRFSADGILIDDTPYYWFNHASNAALSGSTQDGADNLFLAWDRTDLLNAFACDSGDAIQCGGWDKSSDINVQIWAVKIVDGMATGGGWFIPESGNAVNLTLDGSKATFGFVAKSKNTVASGNMEFHYNANGINLSSTSIDWVQIAANQAMFEGSATINGAGSYKFRTRAVDGSPDRLEMTIWTSGGSFDSPLYRAEGNLGGGQIVVKK